MSISLCVKLFTKNPEAEWIEKPRRMKKATSHCILMFRWRNISINTIKFITRWKKKKKSQKHVSLFLFLISFWERNKKTKDMFLCLLFLVFHFSGDNFCFSVAVRFYYVNSLRILNQEDRTFKLVQKVWWRTNCEGKVEFLASFLWKISRKYLKKCLWKCLEKYLEKYLENILKTWIKTSFSKSSKRISRNTQTNLCCDW